MPVISIGPDENPNTDAPREWLVTNGLGGFASGTISGEITRRYHGFLISALPAPFGRMVMLNDIDVAVERSDGTAVRIRELGNLVDFRLTMGLPSWRYSIGHEILEQSVTMPARHNIAHVTFRLTDARQKLRLRLQPWINFRPLEAPASLPPSSDLALVVHGSEYEVTTGPDAPVLRLMIFGDEPASFTADGGSVRENFYATEAARGYEASGLLWSPGYFSFELGAGREISLAAGTEPWHAIVALHPAEGRELEQERRRRLVAAASPAAQSGMAAELVLAADSFIITPVGRAADIARAHAAGDEMRTVIAGYHWFTDWGRDTMISLEGLTLSTGRIDEAASILRAFAHYVRDGLIPNMFPEGNTAGLYNTADASLWFVHAVGRYLTYHDDPATLAAILPVVKDIVQHHLDGTRFGIRVDPTDGLLTQGAEGYQLTWMDAKVGDWVVTPRRGKAVEVNALWYNALCLFAEWLRRTHDPIAGEIAAHAAKARASFNERFWYEAGGYLYDVVDGERGDDAAFRPNQVIAIALPNPVLDQAHWPAVVEAVRERLLTPLGLRSLAPGEPDFQAHYFGDLRARDRAYHQGTVWAWLIGPFVDAWLKTYPQRAGEARGFLAAFAAHLGEAGIGSISEIFDAVPPFTPRGCIAQAWGVAEVLRCVIKTTA